MSFNSTLYSQKSSDYYSYERKDMLAYVPDDVRWVLDVGCSSGGFGKLVKEKFNCKVWGVEPTPAAVDAEEWLDRVYHDYFHDGLDFGGTKFDLIVFNDVLEHLENPWAALRLCKRHLADRGMILASIPNIQCYSVVKDLVVKGNWTYSSSGILDKTHLRFFTKNSIVDLFRSEGYEIVRLDGMNSIIPYSRLLRFLKIVAPKKVEPFTFISYAILAQPVA